MVNRSMLAVRMLKKTENEAKELQTSNCTN